MAMLTLLFVWTCCESKSPNKSLQGKKTTSGIGSSTCFTVFVHSTRANTAAGRDSKCQGSRRKGQGIMAMRQSFCPASADRCFGTSRHSPRLLNDEITLFLSEASFECTWEI